MSAPDPSPPHSARVRLEVDLLASDQHAAVRGSAASEQGSQRTVLVVASDADVREHIAECLRARADLHVVETTPAAIGSWLVDGPRPALLVVDAADVGVLDAHPATPAVLIVDELPRDAPPNADVVLLARPFSARQLESLVDLLLR